MNDIQTPTESTITYTQAERELLMELRTRLGSGIEWNSIAGVDTFESFTSKKFQLFIYMGIIVFIMSCFTIIFIPLGLIGLCFAVWSSNKKIKLTRSLCKKGDRSCAPWALTNNPINL